ncbi:MAG: carbohydrate binding family 9 domain-containing protein, partial [Gemmatimonadota bacterium]|nr:carbohydrate binding family 9 domain-containing protein [Gemmatimonadota bacterium]
MFASAVIVIAFFAALPLRAQTGATKVASDTVGPLATTAGRVLAAVRVDQTMSIDGVLDESTWREAEVARDFIQQRPVPGAPASQGTDVRVLYTDEAIYVGATLLDSAPDSIVAQLGRRDTEIYGDWFWVHLDSRDDNRSAFVFGVNAAGVVRDYMRVDDTGIHSEWDAVWGAAVRVGKKGWIVEMRIPLSQLRFARSHRSWGVNFAREIARREEISYWAPIPPTAPGFVSLFGELHGLRDLEPARQVELRPYVVARVTQAPGDRANPFYRPYDAFSSMGGDVTLGLTSGVTLTATLNPDFGQVEADAAQINLTEQELWLPEQRPFFLDGAELFDTGHPQLFYSRRIGRTPQGALPPDAAYAERPDAATILGAVKMTGKTAGGWSIGVLDAVTAREKVDLVTASREDGSAVVEPLTNYAVARLAREFREGKSGLGLIATAVHRDLDREPAVQFLTSRAFSGGIDGHHRFGKGDYELSASLRASHIDGSTNALTRVQRSSVHR